MSQQQENETQIVQGFLATTKEHVIEIEARDRPDVIVAVQGPNGVKRVGTEVRVYYNDEITDKGSAGKKLNRFWAAVQREIEKLKTGSGHLLKIHAFVELKKDRLEQARLGPLVKSLAKAVFDFVLKASETATSTTIVIPDWEEREFSEFSGYPVMQKHVRAIRVRKGFFAFWDANINASYVGVSPERLAEIIAEKGNQAKDYNTDGLDELWLRIAAPHDTVFNAMRPFPEQAHLDDPVVLAACMGTSFDRIFFWSSPPHEWARQIWPEAVS
jgi:hypothetical protein